MTQPENDDVNKEQPIEQEEVTEEVEQQEEKQIEDGEEDPAEKNWKVVRERRKEEERIRKEQERKLADQEQMIKAMEKVLQQTNQQPTLQSGQEDYTVHDDEWITGKQFKEELQRMQEQSERQKKEWEQQRQQAELQQRLSSQYPDYQSVLNEDNLAYLEYHKPVIAAGIKQIQDPFLQIATAYEQVKTFVPQVSSQDRRKIERTQTAPGSLSDPKASNFSTGGQPSNYRPHVLTKQRKEELWRDMYESAR